MRKLLAVIAAVPLFALVAGATDYPRYETFLGYNFVRFNPNSDFVPSFNANGGSGQFIYNLNKWFGAAVDLGAVTKGTLNGFNVDTTVINFVAGPRFTYRNHSRFTPFAQVLFGGSYATTSAQIGLTGGETLPFGTFLPGAVSARIGASHTGFAMFAGGGLDIKANKHVSFRPIGVDYYLTRVPNLFSGDINGNNTSNRNNFRYSAGVVFTFGAM
jgi:hypothetical protein